MQTNKHTNMRINYHRPDHWLVLVAGILCRPLTSDKSILLIHTWVCRCHWDMWTVWIYENGNVTKTCAFRTPTPGHALVCATLSKRHIHPYRHTSNARMEFHLFGLSSWLANESIIICTYNTLFRIWIKIITEKLIARSVRVHAHAFDCVWVFI